MDRTEEEKSRAKDVSLHHPAPNPVAIVSSNLQPRFRIPLPLVNSMSETSPPDRGGGGGDGGEGGGGGEEERWRSHGRREMCALYLLGHYRKSREVVTVSDCREFKKSEPQIFSEPLILTPKFLTAVRRKA